MTLIINSYVDDARHEEVGHPERPERTTAVLAGLADLRLEERVVVTPARRATRDELARVHSREYLDHLGAFCYEGGGDLDPDTYATYDSWEIAQYAAGAGLAVIDEMRRRGNGLGFVVARPPGHHARPDRAMGFCLLNNIAVSAAALRDQGERVLIVDWDVHHGNGTQEMFWNDEDVLYVSTHEWPLYPGTGLAAEVGGPRAIGTTVNIPVPTGATGDVLRAAIDEVARPVIEDFAPTFVLVSAGFDAHRADPLAGLSLTSGDFADLARTVREFAPEPGRLALFLEGGYNLDALRSSTAATIGTLLDDGWPVEPPSSGGPGRDDVRRALGERRAAIDEMHEALEDEAG